MPSFFKKSLSLLKHKYKVPVKITISDGTSTVITKEVLAYTKEKASKQALGMCLQDIKFRPGDVTRIKG